MATIDRIREECRKNGTSVRRLEAELGFGNGTLARSSSIRSDRLVLIAEKLGVTVGYLLGEETEPGEGYYTDEQTAKTAQAIYDNKELSLLFDAAKDAKPEDLMTAYNVLLALKRKDWQNGG